ncbi:MAG: hypothetical protein NDI69_07870 [Bacteriovoracaceae bacterium]|nr:hypothetical protein [Bacteriovoracaceae bacterium]
MNWYSIEKVWKSAGRKQVKVRFNDWTQQIKYFMILGESTDGKRLIGQLDSGEKMSFSKRSRGWTIYTPEDEYQAHAV